jgi:malate dehydrogenase (oxaloacetate-decarboxylating)
MKNRLTLPEWDILFEIKSLHKQGALGKLLTVIGEEGAIVGEIKTEFVGKTHSLRKITVSVYDEENLKSLVKAINEKTEAQIISYKDLVYERHKGGKIHCGRKTDVKTIWDLRYIYTPGVARISQEIIANPEKAREYTSISNSVGIFTNGTRVLGLGDIGPLAGMPVMEGKAVIYDQFVGISAVPILVDTKDPIEFVNIVEKVSKTFGGIHLEDIRIPDCFYIEEELIKRLNKPVMHDDQHGTATVVLAAIISALKQAGHLLDKKIIVAQIGLGAAGFGIAKLLVDYGLEVVGSDLSEESRKRLENYGGKTTSLEDAVKHADVVISTTGKVGLIKPEMVKKGQVILALSNPIPEIFPEEALNAGAAFASDGKSINNALAYPGLFKAALEKNANQITAEMKIAAAEVISSLADDNELVPSPFHPEVHKKVIEAVKKVC